MALRSKTSPLEWGNRRLCFRGKQSSTVLAAFHQEGFGMYSMSRHVSISSAVWEESSDQLLSDRISMCFSSDEGERKSMRMVPK